jgi:hypothetical protein
MIERSTGRTRYIYHGNDGTSIPWNDTAQLNYLLPEVREAVIQTILHVARSFPIIRFDAAMTLAKKHFQRLWFPVRGLGGGIPSRAGHGMSRDEFDAVFPLEFWREVVDRVAVEVPGTLLLAEAFWLMEGYFVRTLGMHRVYNSAFMNMLKQEENAKYRQTIKNVLEFNPEVLKRFVNFMNNPDEKTAVEQFGREGKYFGACVLLSTMPGLPMFGHGQIEGYHEKYGMEYKRSYWDEKPDGHLIWLHEKDIFPLLRRRWLFSGSENFVMYDFYAGDTVNENVFAYSNRVGDHRALVLYHNSYETTAGWVRESVAFATQDAASGGELVRTSLAAALSLVNDDSVYYAFSDHTQGLVFLRNGKELTEKGLFAELGEYEFHVFMDFREIHDDAYGTWGRLCSELNGRGVHNLEDELKQMQFAEVNSAFTALLELLPSVSKPPAKKNLTSAIRRFMAALTTLPGVSLTSGKTVIKTVSDRIAPLAGLHAIKPASRKARLHMESLLRRIDSVQGAWLLLICSLLQGQGVDLSAYGLDYSLKRLLESQEGFRADRGAQDYFVELVEALLAVVLPGETSLPDSLPEKAFTTPAGRRFLRVHESSGIEWLNKERFEDLIIWSSVIALCEFTVRQPAARTVSAWIGTSLQLNSRYAELADHAGYRTAVLKQLLRPAADTGIRAQKTTRKKTVPRKKPDAKSLT